jgi:predicted RNA binding protein YcfA (HicA-like mRNA interferase family)
VSQLPAVTGKQLLKVLEDEGWYVKRIRGSHHILRHPTVPAIGGSVDISIS